MFRYESQFSMSAAIFKDKLYLTSVEKTEESVSEVSEIETKRAAHVSSNQWTARKYTISLSKNDDSVIA